MNTQIKQIAERLRGLRDALGISVAQAAEQSGTCEADFTRYESGTSDIPISFICQVAQAFGIDTTTLISGTEPHMNAYFVTRKDTGMGVERTKAYKYQSLASGFMDAKMETFEVTVEPNELPVTLNAHPGQEFNHLLEGSMQLNIGTNVVLMNEGDSIYFDARIPHGMKALGGRKVRFLAVVFPLKRQ